MHQSPSFWPVDPVYADIAMPSSSTYDRATTLAERVTRLLSELAEFYVRTERWYLIWQGDVPTSGPWSEAEARFYAVWQRLMAEALRDLINDPEVVAMVGALSDPRFLGVLAQGRTWPQAATLAAAAITPWLEGKSASHQARAR